MAGGRGGGVSGREINIFLVGIRVCDERGLYLIRPDWGETPAPVGLRQMQGFILLPFFLLHTHTHTNSLSLL